MFPPYSEKDREILLKTFSKDLEVLCISFIQEIYEYGYVERFLQFAEKLDKASLISRNYSVSLFTD